MSSFLFLAPAPAPYGEAICGLEIARAAHAAGNRVVFLHPKKLEPVFAGAGFPRGHIDDVMSTLVSAVTDAIRTRSIDVLVLVDAVSTFGALGASGWRSLQSCGAKVVTLDLWSCHETNLVWDMGEINTALDPSIVDVPALRPCPVARPGTQGAYRALPDLRAIDRDERRRLRAELGIAADDRVVFTASGSWQSARMYPSGSAHRIASAWPSALDLVVKQVGSVRVVHVGPEPFDLGVPYIHLRQLPPAQFQRWLAASDVVISNNLMATSIASAFAVDIASVFIRNTAGGASVAEVADSAGHALMPEVEAWLQRVLPLRPFAVNPLGLHGFLAPVIANNPYFDAVDLCEILDPAGTARRLTELLDGDPVASAARAAYRSQIAALPPALDRLLEISA